MGGLKERESQRISAGGSTRGKGQKVGQPIGRGRRGRPKEERELKIRISL